MQYLFSPRGLRRLEPYLAEDTLLAFDFDGTLAPIVPDPDQARLPPSTAELLGQLSRKAPVALISGRSATDLKSRSQFKLKAWIGNHGMEGLPGKASLAKAAALTVGKWEKDLRAALAPFSDLTLENKTYSLTVHYRASKKRGERKAFLLDLANHLHPSPRIIPGKCVLNFLVPGHPHKGTALCSLLNSLGHHRAIFVGDDDTDEDVFRLQDPRIFSIRIGARPDSEAEAFLRRQQEVDRLLQILLSRHPR